MKIEEYKRLTGKKKKHKYNAQHVTFDGIKFPSRKQAVYYSGLMLAKKAGNLKFFLREVPFDLPGGIKYRLDFLEFWKSGEIKFVEVKGYMTDVARIKLKQVEEIYSIEIEVI